MKLKEVCLKIGSGATPRGGKEAYKENGISLIRSQNVLDFKFSSDGLAFIDDEQACLLKNVNVQSGDVLLNITGDSVARACIVNDAFLPARVNQHVAIIRADPDFILQSYILYFLQLKKAELLQMASGGATRNALTKAMIEEMEIPVPTIEQQKKIVAGLDAINLKIQNNQKINDNLEQQAMTLFVHTFIDDPPCGESRPLYDFADYINGAAFKQDDYSASGLPIIKIAELKNGITDSTQFFAGDKGEKYLIHDKDILFSWSGNPDTSIDIFIWASGDAILNQHTFNVKCKEGFRWFVYLMLKYFKPQFAQIASNKQTTGLGHVTATDLKRLTFIYDRDRIASFEETIEPTMEMMFNNILENRSLISLRDFLLPRLMSGEIDVSSVTA